MAENPQVGIDSASRSETPPSSAAPHIPQVLCRACGRVIDRDDAFCRHCGRRQVAQEAWFLQPVWILVLAFLVLGPFALPLVWLSPRMSHATKVGVSAIIIVYTGFALYTTFALSMLLVRLYSSIGQLGNTL